VCLGAGLARGAVLLGWAASAQRPLRVCLGAPVERAQALAGCAVPAPQGLLLDAPTQAALHTALSGESAGRLQTAPWTGQALPFAAFMTGPRGA
jgi:hypothetical protein